MRREHLGVLQPLCPLCRRRGVVSPLTLSAVDLELEGHVVEGMLACQEVACQREYPILDGLPLLLADLRSTVQSQLENLLIRGDLGERLESVIGDCCGADSSFAKRRAELSTWGHDHWGDGDPPIPGPAERSASILQLVDRALELAPEPPLGPVLDVGCALGRSSFELARVLDRRVLGVDSNFTLLQVASRLLRFGEATYPLRRVGLVYERRHIKTRLEPGGTPHDHVDFWLGDAHDLPFSGVFSMVMAFDLIDHVVAPRQVLAALASQLAPGGLLILASSYRGPAHWGSSEAWPFDPLASAPRLDESAVPCQVDGAAALRVLLQEGHPEAGLPGLEIVAEDPQVLRVLRLHDRSSREERLHMVVAKAPVAPPEEKL